MKSRVVLGTMMAFAILLAAAVPSHAQATRTWVSGVGDDANPCSRTAPCKTFAGAISKTAPGGEINVLDPGGFGGVTITKAITISSEGFEGGVLVSGTNAIIISAGAGDRVVLRGLDIEGLGTGLDGIKFLTGAALQVEKCTINNFTGFGINFSPGAGSATTAKLFVTDTIIRNNLGASGGGILISPAAGITGQASIDNVRLQRNTFGLKAQGGSSVHVRDSIAAGNTGNGFWGTGTNTNLNLTNVQATNNGNGVISDPGAVVRIAGSSITGNTVGVQNNAVVGSLKNNIIDGNNAGNNTVGNAIVMITPL